MTTHKQSLCLFQVAGKDRMAQYSVSRISRLVDMYHGLHAALDKEGFGNEENRSEAEGRRRFSCPTCKRRNWSSIETFRTHKLACRWSENLFSNDYHLAGPDPKRLPSNNATTVVLPLMGSTNCENIWRVRKENQVMSVPSTVVLLFPHRSEESKLSAD